jgi:phosphoribosylanthranilate isomerase|tara:strand:+ start:934 stop:1551 length:618 start_codon:yes stop_codon:yes gene_type:complete
MIKGIKICGVSDFETLKFIVNHPYPPNYIGFITNYEKSKRFVDYEKLKELLKIKRQNINFVSVMVKPSNEFLKKIENLNFDYYQLYDVSPDRIKTIRNMKPIKIISALTINEKKDVNKYKDYLDISEIILFDGKGYEKSIGFDHDLLNDLPSSINKMIAGDIKIEDILKFKDKDFIIDISGSLENNEGKKDLKKINKLLNLVKEI